VAIPLFFFPLAEAYREEGRIEEAHHLVSAALAAVEDRSECFWEAELHRLQGKLYLWQTTPNAYQAEVCFHQALAVARRQEAKALELRAVMSLARLWQCQGKQSDARRILEDIYAWFSEGFDTIDLQEARALLEDLT
jgi:predicted ATPase